MMWSSGGVLETRPHPNADRLTLCRVIGAGGRSAGRMRGSGGGRRRVLPVRAGRCGAPGRLQDREAQDPGRGQPGNALFRARTGAGRRSRRASCCSRASTIPGAPFAPAVGLDDVRFDVEVTPNRGDLLSHVGIARELHPEGRGRRSLLPPVFPGGDARGRPLPSPGAPPGRPARPGVRIRDRGSRTCVRGTSGP